MKHFKFPLLAVALLASSLMKAQTTYYTVHAGAWNDTTAWSSIGIDSASCACSPGCNALTGIVYIGNSINSNGCLNGVGPNAAIMVNAGDTLTILITPPMGGKLPVTNSTINIASGGVMIINGELDITAGDTINNSGVLTVNGNVTDTNSGAYLAGTGIFNASGIVSGTTIFTIPQLWLLVPDTNSNDTATTSIVYTAGNVGIGTTSPTKPLQVHGDVLIDDTLIVPVIISHHLAPYPGDSGIHIGDSSIVMGVSGPSKDNIYNSNTQGVAIGVNNTITGLRCAAIGGGNKVLQSFSIVTGFELTNNIAGAIMMGGYSSISHVPAISIIPDIANHTSGFVGIGTTSPDSYFNIMLPTSPTKNAFSVTNSVSGTDVVDIDKNGNTYVSGNLGIGTLPTSYSLDVNGTINASGLATGLWTTSTSSPYTQATPNTNGGWTIPIEIPNGGAIMTSSQGALGKYLGFGMTDANNNPQGASTTGWYWIIQGTNDNTVPACYPMTLIMDASGNATLTITQNSWQDYVFNPGYNKMSIEEKEHYYKTNQHLPGIDPANTVEKKGLNINKNISGILQNLEEDRIDITELYKVIQQQQKEIDELKTQLTKSKE